MSDIIRIAVCSGTACSVMGGSELLLLDDHFPARWKDKVSMEGSPCLGFCKDKKYGQAPYAKVDDEVLASATLPSVLAMVAEKLGER
jgi:NADH:ubiquinone oxidoreductase subunit E